MDNNKISVNKKNIEWKEEHETILIDWADKAMCYRWLHSKTNTMYSIRNAWFTIPVIIISTVTGTANFAQDRFKDEHKNIVIMIIGTFNILAGIITTIHQFLKISELNEAHRVSSIAWGKFHRNIKVELSKSPEERMSVTNMLKLCKEEFDRLMETSPQVPDSIIKDFKDVFDTNQTSETLEIDNINNAMNYSSYDQISKPEICDELISTKKFRYIGKENLNSKFENEILEFIKKFIEIHGRNPMNDEIKDQFKNKIELKLLVKLIDKLQNENETGNENENENGNIVIDLKKI